MYRGSWLTPSDSWPINPARVRVPAMEYRWSWGRYPPPSIGDAPSVNLCLCWVLIPADPGPEAAAWTQADPLHFWIQCKMYESEFNPFSRFSNDPRHFRSFIILVDVIEIYRGPTNNFTKMNINLTLHAKNFMNSNVFHFITKIRCVHDRTDRRHSQK